MSYNKLGINVEKKIHNGWIDFTNDIKQKNPQIVDYFLKYHPMGHFGKYQFTYSSKKGKISMIKLLDYHRIGSHIFEIYCLDKEGGTPAKIALPDTQSFINRKDAIKRVIELLRTDHGK